MKRNSLLALALLILLAGGLFGQMQITTSSPLPPAFVGRSYSLTFSASGGMTPYRNWRMVEGSIPAGLSIDATTGVLSGTPTAAGSYTIQVYVNDSRPQGPQTASKVFNITVYAAPPTLSITDFPATPAQQPSFSAQISAAYTLDISGTITLTFTPASGLPNDPNIQFSTGGRTLNFTILAGSTSSTAALQTGTVAGTITLTVTDLRAAGQSILPSPPPSRSVTIARSAPVITSVQVVRTGTGFNVKVIGYSTPRQMTRAEFGFTGAANLQTLSLVVLLDNPTFSTWYAGESSQQFGSQFLYTQPFSVQGDMNAITLVSVTLVNTIGSSQTSTASF